MSILSQISRISSAATSIKNKTKALGLTSGGPIDSMASELNQYSLQTKTVTLSGSAQTITPDTNKLLTSVSVPAARIYYYKTVEPDSALGSDGDICLVIPE